MGEFENNENKMLEAMNEYSATIPELGFSTSNLRYETDAHGNFYIQYNLAIDTCSFAEFDVNETLHDLKKVLTDVAAIQKIFWTELNRISEEDDRLIGLEQLMDNIDRTK